MKDGKTSGRRGLPITERRRIPMGIRVTPELRDQLVGRAEATGRSITQEIELLLERATHMGSLLDEFFDFTYRDPQLVGLLLTMGEAMRDTLTAIKAKPDWVDDPNAFAEVAIAAQQTIEAYRPLGKPAPNAGQLAVAMVRWTLLKILEGSFGIAVAVRNRIGETSHRLRAWQGQDDGWIVPAPEEINQ